MKNFLLKRIKKKLVVGFSYKAGRNFLGRKTIFTQGGGIFKKVYLLDLKRNLPYRYKIMFIQKDLNRKGFVGLICYEIGLFCYILLSDIEIKYDQLYFNFVKKNVNIGNSSFLFNIKSGNFIHHVEFYPNNGAKLLRAVGVKASIVGFDKKKKESLLKLPSGWLLKLSSFCIGIFGIMKKEKIDIKKAGDKRNLGFRPRVRGVAMNPCDHPHGGGEGKKAKPRIPKSPWGKWVKSPTKIKRNMNEKRKKWKKK